MSYQQIYFPITIEVQQPDGSWHVRNRFAAENSAVQAGNPKWPRERLIDHATNWLFQWIANYRHDEALKMRVSGV